MSRRERRDWYMLRVRIGPYGDRAAVVRNLPMCLYPTQAEAVRLTLETLTRGVPELELELRDAGPV